MTTRVCILIIFTGFLNIYAQTINDTLVVKSVADYILNHAEFTFTDASSGAIYQSVDEIDENANVIFTSPLEEWHYTNGVLNMAMINLSAILKDEKYFNFAAKHIAFGMDNYKFFQKRYKPGLGPHYLFPFGQLWMMKELDDFGAMGASMIEIYKKVKREDYKEYILNGAKRISQGQERLADGTLVRKFPHEMTLWADDLYMSVPFLVRLSEFTGDNKYLGDAIHQVFNFTEYLWDSKKELYWHCYYNDIERNGVAHWGRCNGWVMMAKIHLLNHLPVNHPERAKLIRNLEMQILGIAKYQNGDGLWHQILDKTDSYTETSCTAMFVYCIARAVNQGWIDKRYGTIALTGWDGLKEFKITNDGQVKDVCIGTGIEDNLVFYYNRPARLNEKHGLGAVIDAGVEIIKLKKE